jgi:hypothetical protein
MKGSTQSVFRWLGSPWGIAVVAAFAVAFAWDLFRMSKRAPRNVPTTVGEDVRQVLLGLADPPYVDPAERFSLVPPSGWIAQPRTEGALYDISFSSAGRAGLSIVATPVEYNELRDLYRDIRRREQSFSISTHLETTRFGDRPAIRRTAQLQGRRLMSYDFVENHVAYHLLLEIPDDYAKDYEFALGEVLKTFKPLGVATNGPERP